MRLAVSQNSSIRIRRSFTFGKIKDFVVKAWKDTYPDEDQHQKSFASRIESTKKEAMREREEREKLSQLTPEEIEEVPVV